VLGSGDLTPLGTHGQDRPEILACPEVDLAQSFGVVGEKESIASNHRIDDHIGGGFEIDRPSPAEGLGLFGRRCQYAGAEECYADTSHSHDQGVPHRLT
jgi:hypothetical protein